MPACRRSAGRLLHSFGPAPAKHLSMFVSQRTSLMWQNASDDDLRRRPTGSRRLDRLEPCRTVTGRPGWPTWNTPDVELEASVAPVALAWCGRNVERLTPNGQPHSGQTAAGSSAAVCTGKIILLYMPQSSGELKSSVEAEQVRKMTLSQDV